MRFLYLNWLIVAKPLRRYSLAASNAITVSDFLSNRFHEKKKIIMAIASVFILVFFAVYAGSCFVTCGKLFSKLFGQNYQLMMVVGALFVLLYTFLGGFLAESASDFMQAIVMIIALVLVLTLGVSAAGGFLAVLENARQIPGFFDFFFTATPQVDANGVQQLTAAVLIGTMGRVLLPTALNTASQAENVFVVLSQLLPHPLFASLVMAGILAATISSSDSYLLIAASAFSKNLYQGIFKRMPPIKRS